MDIVDKIVSIRKKRGISQQRLSELTGILQPVIARVESKRSSPTVEFLSKILDALDLQLELVDAFESPKEIKKIIKGLSCERIVCGRSRDNVYAFGNKYLLKISDNKSQLRLEKEKNEWISEHIHGPSTIKYAEDEWSAYYLRDFLVGHTLIEKQYLDNPTRLINVLKDVNRFLRTLDSFDCPFSSFGSDGNDFVHGDLCLPNILVDDNDAFLGFVDVSNSGKGDKQYDYCWLLWSFEYNLKTNAYNNQLLKELNIEINQSDYLKYVILKMNNSPENR